jgi:anti-sigma factor RsiW
VCNKFEELGLLYVSGELSVAEAREYESHIAGCEECRRETETYRKERAELYTADILSERPSPATDAEILRVCSAVKKTPTTLTPILFLKKYAPVPVFLMLVMVAVGGYFRYHSMAAGSLVSKYGGEVTPLPSQNVNDNIQAPPPSLNDEELAMSDSGKSIQDTNAPYSKTLGDLNREGVITVKGEGDR